MEGLTDNRKTISGGAHEQLGLGQSPNEADDRSAAVVVLWSRKEPWPCTACSNSHKVHLVFEFEPHQCGGGFAIKILTQMRIVVQVSPVIFSRTR